MSENKKKHILFVDDEQDVLDGLKRMLRGMRKEWEMDFVPGGKEALDILAKTPFDVVVSDMRMPGMDGAQLLSEVVKRYPNIVRIVLSGHSEREMVMKSVNTAHQYLAKPCAPETLINVVGRACSLRDILEEESLKQAVSQLDSLPSFPDLYFELIEELKSPESSMGKIGSIISKDMSMTAKILQLVNSAFFGMPQHVSSPAQAANLLGLDVIKALVLSTHVFSFFDQEQAPNFSIKDLWDHSAATAVCAKEISKIEIQNNKIIDEAFMAGILHDVGMLILTVNLPEKFEKLIKLTEKKNIMLYEAESSVMGATHAEIGAYLLGLWGLPNHIVEAVLFHHTPRNCLSDQFTPLTAVHVASALEAENRNSHVLNFFSKIDHEYLDAIGMTDRLPKWAEICQQVIERGVSNE